MFFWNIEKLKDTIRAGNLTEKSRFLYLLIYVALSVISIEIMAYYSEEGINIWSILDSSLAILVTLLGTYFAYKSNGSGDGKDFLGKYFSLGFVVTVRFIVYLIPLLAVYLLIYLFAYEAEEGASTTWLDVVFFQVWLALLYWRLCVHIKQTNS